MNFLFHPEAEEGFNEAIDYYEDIEQGFGYDSAINRISKGMGRTRRRNQTGAGKTISLWYFVFRRARGHIYCGSNASSSQARLLEK